MYVCTRKPAHNIRLWRRFFQIPLPIDISLLMTLCYPINTHSAMIKGRLSNPSQIRYSTHIMPHILCHTFFRQNYLPCHTHVTNLPNPSLNSMSQISNLPSHNKVAVGNHQYIGNKIFSNNSSTFKTSIFQNKFTDFLLSFLKINLDFSLPVILLWVILTWSIRLWYYLYLRYCLFQKKSYVTH